MKRRMAQPLFVLSVAVTLVLTLSVVVLSAQFQPIVPDIGFEIEGNTALDLGGDFDWENAPPPAARIPDPNSKIETDPTTFKPNSKFDDPAGWSIMPGKVGPGQSELVNFLVWDIPPGDLGGGRPNDHWLVLGTERIKTPGFFELDFEYNQAGWDGSSGGLTRTPGDVLVGFELRGKPTSKRAAYKVLLLQYWPGAQPSLCSTTRGPGGEPELVEVGTDPCPLYSESGWYYRLLADDALSAESGLVQATMNTAPFSPPWLAVDGSGNPCGVIGPYQFAEAAINLTALGIEPDCSDPGAVHAKSRSAPHVQSDLKDLVSPVELTKCEPARLDGHKFLDVDGDGSWSPDEPPLEGWEIKLSDGSVTVTHTTDEDGYYAFEDLDYGTYTVSEVCPDDWVQTAPGPTDFDACGSEVHTVELSSCNVEVKDLDFGNGRPALVLDKSCDPGEGMFGFTIQVENTGNVLLQDVLVEDPLIGLSEIVDLAPGASETFEGQYPDVIDENTATATAQYAEATITASATVECPPTPPIELLVTKDAQTSFTRTYLWTLEKTVDNPGPILLYPGDYVDVGYQVVAGLDSPAYVDSDWAVEGTITIQSLTPYAAPLAAVTDLITPGDIPVPVDCEEWIVPALGSVTCSYGPISLPDGSDRTNTATVTVQDYAGEWSGTADVVFDQPTTEIDNEVIVDDSNAGVLGGVRYDETPRIFTYPGRIRATGEMCRLFDVPNTATLTTNDTGTVLQADANVQILEVCQVTIVYEDLRYPEEENDWDYNDLVVHIPIRVEVSEVGDLLAANFEVTQDPVRTAFIHTVYLQPYVDAFVCSGTYTKRVTTNGVIATETGAYNPGDSFLLIPDTREAGNLDEFLVELRVDFDVPTPGDCPRDFGDPDPINQYHGEWLFFDPWLTVYREDLDPPTTYDIHVTQPPDDPEPRILTVPADWVAPEDDWVPIWDVYQCVYPPVVAGDPPIFTPYWWDDALCMP